MLFTESGRNICGSIRNLAMLYIWLDFEEFMFNKLRPDWSKERISGILEKHVSLIALSTLVLLWTFIQKIVHVLAVR